MAGPTVKAAPEASEKQTEPSPDNGSHLGSTSDSNDDDSSSLSIREVQTPRLEPLAETKSRRSRASEEVKRTTSNVIAKVTSRITTRDWPEPPPPPDGGMKAWIQVAAGWLVIFTTWGYVNSFGAFQTYYTSTMPQSPSAISWIGSVQIWLTLIIGVFSGRLLDAGLFLPTFFVGAVLQVLGMFLMSISTEYWQLMLTQGILTGIGGGIFFTPAMALVTTYFQKRRGLAVGLVTTGNSAGGMIYPVVVRELIPKLGFAWTARVLAFINLGALALVAAFMRPRLPPRRSGPILDVSAFREPVYMSFVAGMFVLMWGNYFTFYYIASFGREALGLSYADASIVLIVLNGVGLPFRVIFPMIADRIGPMNMLVPVLVAWVAVCFAWLGVKDTGGYYAFSVLYGVCTGGMQCLFPTIITSITNRLDMAGTRLGMAFGITSFASLTGPPLGGAIIGANGGSYTGAQTWAAVMTLLGLGFDTYSRMKRAEWKLKARV